MVSEAVYSSTLFGKFNFFLSRAKNGGTFRLFLFSSEKFDILPLCDLYIISLCFFLFVCTGSGEIDFDEFLTLMAAKQSNMTMEDELRGAFNIFDKDGSGFISSDELKQVRYRINPIQTGYFLFFSDQEGSPLRNFKSIN